MLLGVVTGHRKLPDGMFIHTSPIRRVLRDPEREDGYIFESKNSSFYVSITDYDYGQCAVEDNGTIPGLDLWLSGLEEYSAQYAEKKASCAAEPGTILLRLGNNREYYFDAMDVDPGTGERLSGQMWPHVGMVQDSVLCCAGDEPGCSLYDLRYFPYRGGNLEFYVWDTGGLPVYIENSGDSELRVCLDRAVYLIKPGSRVLMEKANSQPGAALTSEQDLYDVMFFDPLSDKKLQELVNMLKEKVNTEEETNHDEGNNDGPQGSGGAEGD